ncbi:MAG: S49 family peptidase [Acuticoccus sp.]
MRLWPGSRRTTIPHVRLTGAIGMGSTLRPGLSLAGVESALEKAFAIKGAPCVALSINSPGGAPAQTSLIFSRIRALSAEKNRPVVVFVEDVAASGGYWLALAGEEIFVDATSIVGSIGVIFASFGFTELIAKVGVERRVYTAGRNKAVLDPFRPVEDKDVAILAAAQSDIHDAFVEVVRARRGDRLGADEDLFTGAFWTGRRAVELGLVDGVGSLHQVMRERYGEKVRIKPVPTHKPSLLRGRLGLAGGLTADSMIGALRADSLHDRYGL